MPDIHISLAAEKISQIGGIPVTNSMISSLVVTGAIALIAILIRPTRTAVPKGIANAWEALIEGLLTVSQQVLGQRAQAIRYFPLVATIFIFVIFNNYFGLLPGVGSILVNGQDSRSALFRAGTADLNTTLAIALISVLATQYYGMLELGFFNHWKKYFNFSNPILFFVGLLEFISELTKMVSFSFRLFGNIFAGEVLLVSIGAIVPLVAPVPFYGLELFVGFIQATVFGMLTLVFLKIATAHDG